MTVFLLILLVLVVSVVINKMVWGEEITIAEMAINLLAIVIILVGFWAISINSRSSDVQVLNGKVVDKEIDRVHCRHSYPCRCYTTCRGKSGCTTHCSTCYVHLFDNDYIIKSTIGKFFIDTIDSQGLKIPPRYTEVKQDDPVSKTDSYRNYIRGSETSIFGKKITLTKEELKEIPKYPSNIYDYYKINRIIDLTGTIQNIEEYNLKLSDMLKEIGHDKQANVVIVITDKTEEFALKLLEAWYGGKKNDVVLVIGVSQNKINYVRIHSWSLHSIFDVKLRDSILDHPNLDLDIVINKIGVELKEDFVRRSFKEFEYLRWQVLPSDTAILIFVILSLIISTAIGYFMSKEDIA